MKHYRLKDVPKKKWPGYILTYYWPHITAAVLGISLIIWLSYMFFFHKRPDLSVLWLASDYDILSDTVIRERMQELPWDINGDGKVSIGMQYVDFEENSTDDMQLSMQLLTLLSAGEFNVFLADETGLSWLRDNGLLGTRDDLGQPAGAAGADLRADGEEEFCVPCRELEIFRLASLPLLDEMYLAVAKPPGGGKPLTVYERQMEAVRQMLDWKESAD